MEHHGGDFGFSVTEEQPNKQRATVIIGKDYIQALYNDAVHSKQKKLKIPGFSQGETSIHYIEQNYQAPILEHLKEVLFSHCVLHLLYDSLTQKKLVVIGDPDLVEIKLRKEGTAEFVFSLCNAQFSQEQKWKSLKVKPAKRKKYKDIDRQVKSFIKEELTAKEKHSSDTITTGDWVNFEVSLLNEEETNLIPGYTNDLWVKIAKGEDDISLQELFLGKKEGELFLSNNPFLQNSISGTNDVSYAFMVTIKKRLSSDHFCIDLFDHHFGIENKHAQHEKLVEVFSTRKDIPQRRETIEAAFKALHKQYDIKVPDHLLRLQQESVLSAIQASPNYHVYKARDDFYHMVTNLARKQLKEAIIVDTIGYQEGLSVDSKDICGYLNLLTRPRTKDFIYFLMPSPNVQGHERAIPTALLKKYCLREKALNHILNEILKQPKL